MPIRTGTTSLALGGDHFAPRFIVGNQLSGAPAVSEGTYFRYITDPGDGTGIAQAVTEMTALGFACDLCIQEGTYTRQPGLPRFVVPAGCHVWSPGGATIVTNDVDDCIFQLGAGAELERLTLTQRGTLAAAGAALIESTTGSPLAPTRVSRVTMVTPVQVRGMQLVGGSYDIDACVVSFIGAGAAPVAISIEGGAANPAFFNIRNSIFSLTATQSIRFGFTGGVAVRDSLVQGCRFALAAGIVPIAAGAQSDRCTAALNISRGSGSTLPTDAGTFNSINPGVANTWGP